MAKKEKKVEEVSSENQDQVPEQQEEVLVTFSYAPGILGRFTPENNQAMVKQSELKANEKFVVINGKTYIQVSEPSHTVLL